MIVCFSLGCFYLLWFFFFDLMVNFVLLSRFFSFLIFLGIYYWMGYREDLSFLGELLLEGVVVLVGLMVMLFCNFKIWDIVICLLVLILERIW